MSIHDLASQDEGGFWYLASPYTHKDPAVREERAVTVNKYAAQLLRLGIFVYSPIHATHRIACEHELPTEFEFWHEFNSAFIRPATGIIVATMPGWKDSRGIAAEIEFATDLRKPVWLAHDDWQGFRVEKLTR